jgi:hypothetical protein
MWLTKSFKQIMVVCFQVFENLVVQVKRDDEYDGNRDQWLQDSYDHFDGMHVLTGDNDFSSTYIIYKAPLVYRE